MRIDLLRSYFTWIKDTSNFLKLPEVSPLMSFSIWYPYTGKKEKPSTFSLQMKRITCIKEFYTDKKTLTT